MNALFIAACLIVIAIMLWTRHCLARVARGPARSSWLPGVLAIGAVVIVYDWTADRDAEARLAMERQFVTIDGCPVPAPGLSDTIALVVNAPAGVAPRVADCFRHQERGYVIREQRHARKDKIAEAR